MFKGFLEASCLYQPLLIHPSSKHFKQDSSSQDDRGISRLKSFQADGSEKHSMKASKINTTKFFSSYIDSGLPTDNNSNLFWDTLAEHRHLLHGGPYFAYDVETVLLLLHEEPPHEKACNIVVWVMSRAPSNHSYEKIQQIIEMQHDSRRNVALLIVMAAEVRVDLPEDEESSLKTVAEPFQSFIHFFQGVMKQLALVSKFENDSQSHLGNISIYTPRAFKNQVRRPRLKLCHWLTFSEVLASSFLIGFDQRLNWAKIAYADSPFPSQLRVAYGISHGNGLNKIPTVNTSLPSVELIRAALSEYMTTAAISRIIGRQTIAKTSTKKAELTESKKFTLSDIFKKPVQAPAIDVHESGKLEAIQKAKELLEEDSSDKIKNYGELAAMKRRFEDEYTSIMLKEVREFMALFLDECHRQREIRLRENWSVVDKIFCGLTTPSVKPSPEADLDASPSADEKPANDAGCIVS